VFREDPAGKRVPPVSVPFLQRGGGASPIPGEACDWGRGGELHLWDGGKLRTPAAREEESIKKGNREGSGGGKEGVEGLDGMASRSCMPNAASFSSKRGRGEAK